MCRRVQITLRVLPHLVTLNLQATSRDIQWRATSFFKFGLPFPPWMAYIILLKNGLGDYNPQNGQSASNPSRDFARAFAGRISSSVNRRQLQRNRVGLKFRQSHFHEVQRRESGDVSRAKLSGIAQWKIPT